MVVAGEASGDILAAELVHALRAEISALPDEPSPDPQPARSSLAPRFFGAGGARMKEAGVDISFDLTAYAATGLTDVLKQIRHFRRRLLDLRDLAAKRQPDALICVDFSGFNRRLAHAVRRRAGAPGDWFNAWRPLIVQYVSPQVWASRPGRATSMARDYDLLLCTFPFEKEWYARYAPGLAVEFVGNPVIDRYARLNADELRRKRSEAAVPHLLLLPGSRLGELARHVPVMLEALKRIRARYPDLEATLVLPNEALLKELRRWGLPGGVRSQAGGLPDALQRATVAIASTGTVLLECALFGVPTVALYKTSWLTYAIGKRIVTVEYMAMPNLLAGRQIMPEFIQSAATPENIAGPVIQYLSDPQSRERASGELSQVVQSLGMAGASQRAARAILREMASKTRT